MRRVIIGLLVVFVGLVMVTDSLAISAANIDKGVKRSLQRLDDIPGAKAVEKKAIAMLVFPAVFKAGLVIGGEYGEGALVQNGKTIDYYSTAGASIGFQFGGSKKTVILAFMDKGAYDKFLKSEGWKIGADAAVTVIAIGADGSIDTAKTNKPIIAFVFDKQGLMYNVTLEGAKVTKINRK